MLHHGQPSNGRCVIVDCPWCGLGWMISSAASRLAANEPSYVYATNHFYQPRDGDDPSNKWDWFFEQMVLDIPYKIKLGRDVNLIGCNAKLDTAFVHHYRTLIREQWQVRQEVYIEAARWVPQPAHTLGVHYRGTDKLAEVARPALDLVANCALELLEQLGLSRVLLATDDERILQSLKGLLPLQCFEGHLRGYENVGIHQQFGSYRQARETMVEILAVGMTAHMLVGRSCVAEAMLLLGGSDWTYYN